MSRWPITMIRFPTIRLEPSLRSAMIGEAWSLVRIGRAHEARPIAERLLAGSPDDVDVLMGYDFYYYVLIAVLVIYLGLRLLVNSRHGKVLLASAPTADGSLAANAAAWLI